MIIRRERSKVMLCIAMRRFFFPSLLILLLLTGCASTTKITWHDGRVIEVKGAKRELIVMEIGGDKVTSDRRGKANIFQSLTSLILLKGMQPSTEVVE